MIYIGKQASQNTNIKNSTGLYLAHFDFICSSVNVVMMVVGFEATGDCLFLHNRVPARNIVLHFSHVPLMVICSMTILTV